MKKQQSGSGLVRFIVTLALIIGAAWLILNRQAVFDWWRLVQYKPTPEIQQLADSDTMQGRGRDLFYISEPQIQAGTDFNTACSKQGEQTIVLGCYKAQQIYLYNVSDTRLRGVKEVTAAHEMLHAAYERLATADRDRVNTMLQPIIAGMKDQRILDLIQLYNREEPGELYNEMHSILGTEYAQLTPDLEEYYRQYFGDRVKIVGYAGQYQAVFTQSKTKLDSYDQRLDALKSQIDRNNNELKQQQVELESAASELTQLRSAGRIQEYNQQVPIYNARVESFNALVEQTKGLVEQYNTLVAERNQQATAQNDLYQSLDSRYQPVLQN